MSFVSNGYLGIPCSQRKRQCQEVIIRSRRHHAPSCASKPSSQAPGNRSQSPPLTLYSQIPGAEPRMIPSPFASSSIMPSASIVRYRDNIELCVPTGVRFHPTHTQLVEEFLAKRVLGEPFADYLIRDIDVYCCNPDQLPLDIVKGPERWAYFFTLTTQRYQKGSQWNRTTPGGHWRASGVETGIQVGEETVAFTRKLVFYRGNSPSGTKTQYIMQEYRINQDLDRFKNLADPKMVNCVICKVYTKKPRSQCAVLMPRTADRRATKALKRSEASIQQIGDADVKAKYLTNW